MYIAIFDKINYLKKVVLQIVLIIILQDSQLILKKLTFHNVIILIKSVGNSDKSKY